MASDFFLEGEKLNWIIREPYLKVRHKSPIFNLLDINWSFEYQLSFYHLVYLHKESKKIPKKSFRITALAECDKLQNQQSLSNHSTCVSAEFDKLQNIPSLSNKSTRIWGIDEYEFTEVCRWNESSLKEVVDRRNVVLKLTFKFDGITPKLQVAQIKGELQKLGDSCADNLSEDMKALQTVSSFNDVERLSEEMKILLNESSFSDVEVKCGDVSIKAHRNILGVRSKVFAAMLQNDMKEKRSGVVRIEDLDADVLEKFLHYIYTGTLSDITTDVAYKLYVAGEKYTVLGLKESCSVYLAKNFTEDNACDLLVTADLHSDEKFKEKAIDYILEKKIPFRKDTWTTFCKIHPDLACEVLTKAYKLQNQ